MAKDQPFNLYAGIAACLAACFLVVAIGQTQSATVPFDEPPVWAREAVWYQIFVERFRNGDPANDPVLILNDVNGSVVGPSGPPTPTDTLEFDWRAWITVELVIRKKIENMYDFWK